MMKMLKKNRKSAAGPQRTVPARHRHRHKKKTSRLRRQSRRSAAGEATMAFSATAGHTPLARRRRWWVADSRGAVPRASGDAPRTHRGVWGASSTYRDGRLRHAPWGVTAGVAFADGPSVGSGWSGAAVTAHNAVKCISGVRCQQTPCEQTGAWWCQEESRKG